MTNSSSSTKKWHWKAIIGVWAAKFFGCTAVVIAMQIFVGFAMPHSPASTSSLVKSTMYLILSLGVEALSDIGGGYWLAAIVPRRKMGHAVWLALISTLVGSALLPINLQVVHQFWFHVCGFLSSGLALLGAWWRVQTHGADSAVKKQPVEVAPIASPFHE